MFKVAFVFGTRPEAIKLAPVILRAQAETALAVEVIVTGQHKEMLVQVLELFDIVPDLNLDVMTQGQSLSELNSKVMLGLDAAWTKEQPDCVVVHGDTTTTFSAALAAFYRKLPVLHVEAGLRTFERYSPWPEEINRKLTTVLSVTHFAPTKKAKVNLISEGVCDTAIKVTGNTVIDALLMVADAVDTQPEVAEQLTISYPELNIDGQYLLVTGHRRENYGRGFENICAALAELAEKYPKIQIIYAVHLNPNVRRPVEIALGKTKNIILIDPQDYKTFVYLMKHAYLILTDSGGIQEEAPSLGKPVLVMRDTTERPEGIAAGTVMLVGADKNAIIEGVSLLLTDSREYSQMSAATNPYGDGKASEKIVDTILQMAK